VVTGTTLTGAITGTAAIGDKHQEYSIYTGARAKVRVSFLNDLFAEGHQGELHQFKVLAGERYPDDRDEQQRSEEKVNDGSIQSTA
jgi:hypothetical protein